MNYPYNGLPSSCLMSRSLCLVTASCCRSRASLSAYKSAFSFLKARFSCKRLWSSCWASWDGKSPSLGVVRAAPISDSWLGASNWEDVPGRLAVDFSRSIKFRKWIFSSCSATTALFKLKINASRGSYRFKSDVRHRIIIPVLDLFVNKGCALLPWQPPAYCECALPLLHIEVYWASRWDWILLEIRTQSIKNWGIKKYKY